MPSSTPHRSLPKPRTRPRYRAARAFYLTLFIGACFATYALLGQPGQHFRYSEQQILRRRDVSTLSDLNADEQCRLVHRAKDQCAFIKSNCPPDEAGFAAYLDLYYCRLAHAKPVAFTILILWLGLLFSTIGIAASDFFCINLSTISTILGMSESMAGVTFLAFGNGSPDVFSTFAAMSTNSGSLAVGELFGAAGFITAVVAGSMALIRPFHVARKSFVRDVGFFVVAAAFSIVFLWDGKLHFWECIVMVAYYFFYVAFVVFWHWWLGRRRRRRETEAAVRGHYVPPEDLDEAMEEYHDDPDEAAARRPSLIRGVSREDWSALERAGEAYDEEPDEDEEEEARDRWMSELNQNMRLTRPSTTRVRTNTLTPVRPSLVGALEFQAVLKSLQKSRNLQTYAMNTRRYSDDPTFTTAQQQDQMSSVSDPASRPPYELAVGDEEASPTMVRQQNLSIPASAPARNRAVSAGDAHSLRMDTDLQRLRSGSGPGRSPSSRVEEDLIDLSSGERDSQAQSQTAGTLNVPSSAARDLPPSPSVEISLASPPAIEGRPSNSISEQALAPTSYFLPRDEHSGIHESPSLIPHAKQLPRIIIPGRERSQSARRKSSLTPFPRYHDDPSPPSTRSPSFHLPPPSSPSPDSLPASQSAEQAESKRPSFLSRIWPYNVLPPPGVMIATLFPTIYHWHEKNYWEKALGVVAAPSVFMLTITLPVVESGKDEDTMEKDNSLESAHSKAPGPRRDNSALSKISGNGEALNHPTLHMQEHDGGLPDQGAAVQGTATANVAAATEQQHGHYGAGQGPPIITNEQELVTEPADDHQGPHQELWNRWLLLVQLFLAPLFIVFAIWSQSPTDISPTWLIKPVLICLLISLVLLVPLLLTSTPTHKPAVYRYILSIVGFVVSIAWISTIASQVVGALKALAVILNMSHAIMGLTIFAVGNSLGDLVADVTVAKLGYPVMALSACFGGPMLNILLGIGISGSYILIRGANKRMEKHPDKDFKFKSYHIEVSNTLIVSGATLLVTLLGLLIAVPMNKWVFSKRIGWVLIAIWTLSTIGNVVIEITGLADKGGHEDMLLSRMVL